MNRVTKRLFYENPYQTEFKADVIETFTQGDKSAVILDQTCFYPESGGQPADAGNLNGIDVLDVYERNGEIVHVLAQPLKEEHVEGHIDWQRRFDHMQQHAGQHVLSQCFHELLNGTTRSFHLGVESSTLEIDIRNISDEEQEEIENRANQIIFQDREIKSYFVDEDQIEKVPLRKPPQKSGLIRVVEVSGFDYSACGGTHPFRTGEIGIVKILKTDRIRNNVRFEFVCGRRAFKDYALKHKVLSQVAVRFTVGEKDVAASVDKMMEELKTQKKANKRLLEHVAQLEGEAIIQSADEVIIKRTFSDKSVQGMRLLTLHIIRNHGFVTLFGLKSGQKVHVILGRSEDMDIDLRDLVSVVSPLVSGKGGGRPSLVEIAGDSPHNLEAALTKAYEIVSQKLHQS